jgi:hypothetical protein
MYRIVIISLSFSICFASNNIQTRMDKLMRSLQEKYQIYSPEDLHKLKPLSDTRNRSFSSRDIDDLFGEWLVLEENFEMYVTVGSDQSMPNMMQMMGMEEAEGGITVTADDYETELTYLFDPSLMGGDEYNWACDGDNETAYYASEEECNDNCESQCYYDSTASGGDDGAGGGLLMNFDLMGYFMFWLGFSPEGVDHPIVLIFQLNDTDNIDGLGAMVLSDSVLYNYAIHASNLYSDALEFNPDSNSVTFTNLSIELFQPDDSTMSQNLTLNGTIGPGMIELLAGVVTEMPIPMLDGEDDIPEVYMIFNEDSTGMEIEITEDEDYGDIIDTSYFDWLANSDSLWLFEDAWICGGDGELYSSEEECNYDCDTDCQYDEDGNVISLSYGFSDDTLFAGEKEYPCEEEGVNTYDECIEEGEMGLFLGDLVDIQDFYIYSNRVMLPTGDNVSLADVIVMPEKFTIHQNYPNPFNPVTTLRYDLPEQTHVNITVYDMLGRKVRTIFNQQQAPGYKSLIWDATNDYGKPVSAGIYLYQIQAGEYMQTKKMVLLK